MHVHMNVYVCWAWVIILICVTNFTSVVAPNPTPQPTEYPKRVFFPVRQRMLNLTLAQFDQGGSASPVRQIFVTAVKNILVCCPKYNIEVLSTGQILSTALSTFVIEPINFHVSEARPNLLREKIGEENSNAATIERNLNLRALSEPWGSNSFRLRGKQPDADPSRRLTDLHTVLEVNYTVSFLFTDFNFTNAESAYAVVAGALSASISSGGFAQSFQAARNAATCYQGGTGSCKFLLYTKTGTGFVGGDLAPTAYPTSMPTKPAIDDANGYKLAGGMAVFMVSVIFVFCYFQYFYRKGDCIKMLLCRKDANSSNSSDKEADADDEAAEEDEARRRENAAWGEARVKSLTDLGDPDLRFGRGHTKMRRESMKAVALQPDYTAADPEVVKSPVLMARRYSTLPISSSANPYTQLNFNNNAYATDDISGDNQLSHLLGVGLVDSIRRMDTATVKSLFAQVDDDEPTDSPASETPRTVTRSRSSSSSSSSSNKGEARSTPVSRVPFKDLSENPAKGKKSSNSDMNPSTIINPLNAYGDNSAGKKHRNKEKERDRDDKERERERDRDRENSRGETGKKKDRSEGKDRDKKSKKSHREPKNKEQEPDVQLSTFTMQVPYQSQYQQPLVELPKRATAPNSVPRPGERSFEWEGEQNRSKNEDLGFPTAPALANLSPVPSGPSAVGLGPRSTRSPLALKAPQPPPPPAQRPVAATITPLPPSLALALASQPSSAMRQTRASLAFKFDATAVSAATPSSSTDAYDGSLGITGSLVPKSRASGLLTHAKSLNK